MSVRKDGIYIVGHAGYADPGKDIVCAGVTALFQSFVKSIEGLTRDKIEYNAEPGRAYVKFKNLSDKGKDLVDSFFIGVCLIADEFPDHVRIE